MRLNDALIATTLALSFVPFSIAAALGPAPTAAPVLVKRVFPTGSAAVASFLSTIDPAQLSTYFSWAAHGNDGFISHAQSFTSANAAQYSSYLAAKNIDSSQANAILGGIQTESTIGGGGSAAATNTVSGAGSGSGTSTGTASGAGSTGTAAPSTGIGSSLITLGNGDVVGPVSSTEANGSVVRVSTTDASGNVIAASTTLSTGTITGVGPSNQATSASSSASGSGASSSSGSQTDDALPAFSFQFASLFATLFAALIAGCLIL